MRRYLKYFYKNFLPRDLRLLFDIFPSIRTEDLPPDILKEKKIIVLAPHPDDEIIGCGGTIYTYHLRNSEITVVFMTDGGKGHEKYVEDELV